MVLFDGKVICAKVMDKKISFFRLLNFSSLLALFGHIFLPVSYLVLNWASCLFIFLLMFYAVFIQNPQQEALYMSSVALFSASGQSDPNSNGISTPISQGCILESALLSKMGTQRTRRSTFHTTHYVQVSALCPSNALKMKRKLNGQSTFVAPMVY